MLPHPPRTPNHAPLRRPSKPLETMVQAGMFDGYQRMAQTDKEFQMVENITPPADLMALSPCPFCGGVADLNGDDTCGYFVSCRTRDCCMFNRAIWAADEIRNAWNTRARPSLS